MPDFRAPFATALWSWSIGLAIIVAGPTAVFAQDPADAVLAEEDPADAVLEEGDSPDVSPPPSAEAPPDPSGAPDGQEPNEGAEDPADTVLDEPAEESSVPAGAANADESVPDPADAVLGDAPEQQEQASPAAPTTTDNESSGSEDSGSQGGDPAAEVLQSTSPPAAAGGGDVADQVLAEEDEQAEETTAPAYQESRQTIEASVSVRKIEAGPNLYDGILIRRKNKGTKGAPARLGFTGVYRTISADLPTKNSFRFGSHFSFYTIDQHWDSTDQNHLDAIGFFTYSVREDLEVRIAGVASGHSSGQIARYGQGALFQTLGDVYLGAKYAYEILPFLHIGGVLDLRFFTKVKQFLLRGDATSVYLNVVSTLNLTDSQWFPRLKFPLRVHLMTGYNLDRSHNVINDVQLPNASTFGGFGLTAGDSIPLLLATEIIQEPLSYFVEYSAEPVVNSRSGVIDAFSWSRSPQRFTLGLRYNPYENILLDSAVDLAYGLNEPVELFGRDEPVGPPYTFHFGIAYEWNPQGWEIIDLRGRVVGIVVDADTGEPLGGAIVEYLDTEKYSAQMADTETGQFSTYNLPPGEVLLKVAAEGYEPVVINPEILQQETIEEKVFLNRISQERVPVGALVGRVVDEEGRPVVADIKFLESDVGAIRSSEEDGSFIKILPEGEYKVEVQAPGYEKKVYRVPILQRKKTKVVFQLLSGESLGALAGTVKDEDNRPLQATIFFLDAQVSPVQTDATGQFMKVLPPGEYAIEARSRGYVSKRYKVPVEEGRKTVVDMELVEEKAVGALAGRILSQDGTPLAGVVTVAKPGIAPVPADPDTGKFQAVVDAGTYEILVEAPGHESRRFRIPVLQGKKTVQDFRLEPQAAGKEGDLAFVQDDMIKLGERVEFEPGTALLKEQAYKVLDAAAKLFLRQPLSMELRVEAHTHNLGPSSANLRLSEQRAAAVQEYLTNIGVPPGRITAVGKGEEEPIADTSTPEGRAKNERIELHLVQ